MKKLPESGTAIVPAKHEGLWFLRCSQSTETATHISTNHLPELFFGFAARGSDKGQVRLHFSVCLALVRPLMPAGVVASPAVSLHEQNHLLKS
jgi:hypothetical protein